MDHLIHSLYSKYKIYCGTQEMAIMLAHVMA
jgi:hypothetical protein